ncbi:UNVERIFIED_CONTAM: hypothetical protein Slati_0444100 [Sesamum latifolium]|uniref:Uncharacterized protein n=1 Tax=Sesamum latifolium TaxID=2727402 RepID=A0AAW2XW06_9LAMI
MLKASEPLRGTSGGSGRGISRLLPAGSTGTGASSSPSSSRTSASGGGANRGGVATDTCSRRAAATICWMAPSRAGDNSSVEVSEDVLRRGGSAAGPMTLGGGMPEVGQQEWTLSPQGTGGLQSSLLGLVWRWGLPPPSVCLLLG